MTKVVIDTCVLLDIIDENRPRHAGAAKLWDYIRGAGVTVRTPMHALFEISARLKNPDYRLTMKMSKALTKSSPLHLDFVPIDESFFQNYYSTDLPYIKGGDLIFLALAHKENLPLITEDGDLRKKSSSIGVAVYSIDEFLAKNVPTPHS
ncbi:MAG: PIN domain-containing protein [Verrucomicrobiaceae bacterium]|nr:PIN domain-containing protein [Verrucomicrobiaceae bacterium]